MNPQLITLIINCFVGAMIFIGFLWGVGRGLYKSTFRLVFVLAICAVMLYAAPTVSNFLVNFDISTVYPLELNGTAVTSLHNLMMDFINGQAEIAAFLDGNEVIASYVEQLPLVVVNIVIFILGVYLLKFLTYPIYAMLAHFLIPKQKKDEEKFYKQNKHRFFGGIVGAVQGFVLVMVLFMPLTSINTLLLSIDQPVALASYAAEEEPADETFSFLKDVLGLDQEMIDYIYSYDDSFFVVALKATKLDVVNDFVFNQLATIEVGGEKVQFLTEAKLVTETYVEASKIIQDNDLLNIGELNETGIIRLIATLDYTGIETIINNVFSSGSVNVLGDEILGYIEDFVREDHPEMTQNDLAELETLIDNALTNLGESNMANLKSDLLSIVHLLKSFQDHDLFAFATTGTYLEDLQVAIDADDESAQQDALQTILDFVLVTVDAYSQETVTEMVNTIFGVDGSVTLKALFPDVVNVGIGALNREFAEQGVAIELIDTATIDWTAEAAHFGTIFYNLKEMGLQAYYLYDDYADVEFTPEMLLDIDVDISGLGVILNTLRSMELVAPIYDGLLNQMLLNPQIGLANLPEDIKADFALLFVDFATIDWEVEVTSLQNLAYEILDVMEAYNFETGEMNIADIDIAAIKEAVSTAFTSSLVKEVVYQAARVLSIQLDPTLEMPVEEQIEQLNILVQKIIDKLAAVEVTEISSDILELLDVAQLLKDYGFLSVLDKDAFIELVDGLSQENVVALVEAIFEAPTINEYFPDMLNVCIALINRELTLDIAFATNFEEFDETSVTALGNVVYNLKQYVFAMSDMPETPDYHNLELLNSMNLNNLGLALNTMRDLDMFDNVYEDLVTKLLLDGNKLLSAEIIAAMVVDTENLDTIDWTTVFANAITALTLPV